LRDLHLIQILRLDDGVTEKSSQVGCLIPADSIGVNVDLSESPEHVDLVLLTSIIPLHTLIVIIALLDISEAMCKLQSIINIESKQLPSHRMWCLLPAVLHNLQDDQGVHLHSFNLKVVMSSGCRSITIVVHPENPN